MLHININFFIWPKYEILRSSSGATPQTLYHVSVASTSRSTTWLPYSYSMVCKLYLKTKDALCKLDGVLVSIQYKSKHIFYIDFTIKSNMSVAIPVATQDIECHEVTKYS